MTKTRYALLLPLLFTHCNAHGAPEIFTKYLPIEEFVKASAGIVVPPKEIEQYIDKVEAAASKNPEWFAKYSKSSKPGVPLPYHENLGLSKEEYSAYIAAWGKRSFEEMQPVALRLEKSTGNEWMLRATGPGFLISSLRYDTKKKELRSPNGIMQRIDDIKGDKDSILGAWQGQEWMHESETSISKTRENFAIGKKTNEATGYLIYRLQEMTNSGRKLYDKRIIIQFPIEK